MTTFARRWFPATAAAVKEARKWVLDTVASSGSPVAAPEVELLVAELATNAVRYGGGGGFLVQLDTNSRIVVAVCDHDTTLPRARTATATETGGRGLAIVEAVADRWGARLNHDGKSVWFELSGDPPITSR